ncbi:putative Blue (type 1) copper binding protein [Helianthus anomalus]
MQTNLTYLYFKSGDIFINLIDFSGSNLATSLLIYDIANQLINQILLFIFAVFNFTTGFHNVAEVSQAAYGPCTTANPISTITTGPATVTLTAAGPHYYICTVGTHCQIGQKLSINVSAATAAPPTTPPPASPPTTPPTTTPTPPAPTPVSPPTTNPSPAPAPSTTTPPPTTPMAPPPVGATPPSPTTSGPSPTGETTPPPPSPSTAARSFTAVVPATFLAVALAFFY